MEMNNMVISWSVTHKNHPRPIELCGRFRDLEQFLRLYLIEAQRGWNVVMNSTEIIKIEV